VISNRSRHEINTYSSYDDEQEIKDRHDEILKQRDQKLANSISLFVENMQALHKEYERELIEITTPLIEASEDACEFHNIQQGPTKVVNKKSPNMFKVDFILGNLHSFLFALGKDKYGFDSKVLGSKQTCEHYVRPAIDCLRIAIAIHDAVSISDEPKQKRTRRSSNS